MALTVWTVLGIAGVGVVVGVMSAMFGVGGGVIMVPFMVAVLEQTQHVAEGTSLLVVIPTALVGALAHRKRGFVDPRLAGLVAMTGVFGGVAGAAIALALDPTVLQTGFGLFTVLVGAKLLMDGRKLSSGKMSR